MFVHINPKRNQIIEYTISVILHKCRSVFLLNDMYSSRILSIYIYTLCCECEPQTGQSVGNL